MQKSRLAGDLGKRGIEPASATRGFPPLAKRCCVRHFGTMNNDTAQYLDRVDEYIQKAQRELAKARLQDTGTREEAMYLKEAQLALDNASTVIGRTLPSD